jgi:ATP-dependent Clp protease adaptor protein ClpS
MLAHSIQAEQAADSHSETATAVADDPAPEAIVRPTRLPAKGDEKRKRQPRYHVLLWNDDEHSYEYVIKMLKELFGHPVEKGFLLAKEVDTNGKAIVLTTTREHAELKCDQIHSYGKDDSIQACKGSMSASIEPETC